jgi:F0F1-type ATP synthase assembly protein I
MKRTDAAIKVRTKKSEKVSVRSEVNKAAVVTMAIAAGLVGAWVVTAFIGGIMASGGLQQLVSNWITAVFG